MKGEFLSVGVAGDSAARITVESPRIALDRTATTWKGTAR